jgi:hypothetical protein
MELAGRPTAGLCAPQHPSESDLKRCVGLDEQRGHGGAEGPDRPLRRRRSRRPRDGRLEPVQKNADIWGLTWVNVSLRFLFGDAHEVALFAPVALCCSCTRLALIPSVPLRILLPFSCFSSNFDRYVFAVRPVRVPNFEGFTRARLVPNHTPLTCM